jgi:hypothetical protein
MATGPLAGGLIYDTFASYGWLYIGAWGIGIGAFLIALTFGPYAAKPTPQPARAVGQQGKIGRRSPIVIRQSKR